VSATGSSASLSNHPEAYAEKGMRYDPAEEPALVYEFWRSQWRVLYYLLEDPDHREAIQHLLRERYSIEVEHPSEMFDIAAMLAGYRSGKSVLGARWVIEGANRLPGTRWLAMGQDYAKARETTFRVLHEQLPGADTARLESDYNGPEQSPIVSNYHRRDHVLTLSNGSVIVEGSADEWNRHAGDEFSGIWLDEPSHYSPNEKLHDMLEMLSTRLSADRGPLCQFWSLTGNGYNAAHTILKEQKDADGDDLGHKIKVLTANVLENPFLTERVRDRLRRQYENSGRAEQALYGGFSDAKGLVYDLDRDTHLVNRHTFGTRLPPLDADYRVYGYDAGFVDPRCVLEIGRTVGDNHLVVLDEFYRTGSSLDQLHGSDDEADPDGWLTGRPSGVMACEHEPEDIEEFEDHLPEWRFERANKAHEGFGKVRNNWINPRDEETGERLTPRLYIHERCENLIAELTQYKEEEIGSTTAEDHAADALRYAVMLVENGNDGLGGGFGTATVSTA